MKFLVANVNAAASQSNVHKRSSVCTAPCVLIFEFFVPVVDFSGICFLMYVFQFLLTFWFDSPHNVTPNEVCFIKDIILKINHPS